MKTTALAALLLLILVAASAERRAVAGEAAARNVVLIVADDLGRDLGAYGNTAVRTPHLDRLAREGTRFDFAFATTASCSASRSVILTGIHNHANGQFGHQHAYHNFHTYAAVRSLPALLAAAGYRTARIGKLHVQPDSVYRFDSELAAGQGGARNPVAMAESCRALITEASPRPFFLYFCPADPHRSGDVRDDSPERPDRFGNRDYAGVREERFDPAGIAVPPFLPDSPACRAELAEYYSAVSRLDQGIGRLLEILREAGRESDTLVVFLSDNGPPFPGAKTNLYEPGTRLPLIVRHPDAKRRGLVSRALVSWVDVTPTLLDFAGIRVPELRLHGRSFLAVLDDERPAGWDEVYFSHTFHEVTNYYPMRGVRDRRYKYILNVAHPLPFSFASDLYASATWQAALRSGAALYGRRDVARYHQRPRQELYDLEKDPDEIVNLAGDAAHAPVLAELEAKLKAFQERSSDPWAAKRRYE